MKLLHDPEHRDVDAKLLPVPGSLRRFLIPWASAAYREYPFSSTLIQEFHTKRFSIYFWRIHADQPDTFYPISDHPTIALQFMITGNISCNLAGYGPKLLQKSRYELFYVPESINEARFEPGDYESLHIEMEAAFLEDIAESSDEARELLSRLYQSSKKGIPMVSVS